MALAGLQPTKAALLGVGHAGQPAGVGVGSGAAAALGPSLDPVPNNSAKCSRVRVLNSATGETAGLPCRQWRCDRCAVSNRRAFRKRLRLGLTASDAQLPKLLTLTSVPGEDPGRSRERLSRRFADVRRRLESAFPGCRVEYAGAGELTRRGAVHFHVVLRGVPYMPQATWSRLVARCGFGPVVDIRRVRSERVGGYLAKDLGGYLTKAAGATRWPPHFRRVRFSRDWAPEWVSHAARRAHGGAQGERWLFLRVSAYHVDEEDRRAGQGRSQSGGVAADP